MSAPTVLCVTGMHRSGTSLVSSFLEKCGVNMGENLIGAAKGNERGHFEDAQFVQFHEKILRSNNCNMFAPKRHLAIQEQHYLAAQNLANTLNFRSTSVGWKDPRSSLFLDLWKTLVPSCKFVFLYREPMRVIDSLRRRGTDRRIAAMPWLPAKAWIHYNDQILSFLSRHREDCLLINIDGFTSNPTDGVRVLVEFLGIPLTEPFSSVFSSDEFSTADPIRGLLSRLIDSYFEKELGNLYARLGSHATIP